MLKKSISFVIIIFVLLLFYQRGVNYFKKSHSISYVNNTNGESFSIEEKYIKNDIDDYYLIKVKYKEKDFLFDVDNLFNKQAEIVEKVHLYNENATICIALDYKLDVESSDIICNSNSEFYSYNSIKDKAPLNNFVSKLKSTKYEEYKKKEKDTLPYDDISINLGYLEDENILVYGYKRIVLINSNRRDYFQFALFDVYKNIYGYVLNNYYIIPKITNSPVIDQYIIYNIEDGTQKDIDLKESISKQIEINGIYDNKLYVFDKSNLKQYYIDPNKKEFVEVANTDKEGIKYINGKKESATVYDLKGGIIFSNNHDDYRSLDYNKIYDNERGRFIVYEKNGKYYKVYKEYPKHSIMILNNNKVSNFTVTKDSIFYLEDTTVYKENKYGKFPILSRKEFKFNNERIFDVYIK